jgi:hypothetical protein
MRQQPTKEAVAGVVFWVTFYRGGRRLSGLGLAIDDPIYGTSWATTDEDGRRRAHHDWLRPQLGPAHRTDDGGNHFWTYPWGEVMSILHPKDGLSSVLIQYRERPRRSWFSRWWDRA